MSGEVGPRVPAPLPVVLGGMSLWVGAALTVGSFDRMSLSAVPALRLVGVAVLLRSGSRS